MKIAIAQIQLEVAGDGRGHENNFKKIADAYNATKGKADIILFPELAITGYLALDFYLREDFVQKAEGYNAKIASLTKNSSTAIAVGNIVIANKKIYNAGLVFFEGKLIHTQLKVNLPNYGVFKEKRHFTSGEKLKTFEFLGKKILYLICEDMWGNDALKLAKNSDVVLVSNASPFEVDKPVARIEQAKKFATPLFYANHAMANDDLVFDGNSFATNGVNTEMLHGFKQEIKTIEINKIKEKPNNLDENYQVYSALQLALKEYAKKNGFEKVLIGLSGGIDSAITAQIAAKTLGAENILLYFLPSKFTSKESLADAKQLAKNIGVKLNKISIKKLDRNFRKTIGNAGDLTLQNLQARIRGVLLMAISNQTGALLLTTGNKSEIAVGYCTLYGDMCGGYNLLKDIYKTKVYSLANYINREGEIIPQNIITKAPTAELKPNQKDSDSLPEYEILDKILHLYIEEGKSSQFIISQGFVKELVDKVIRLINLSEYKRRQSAPGPKISSKPFDSDWHYPISKS
ncbi:MAG: NAD+ synthase [Alphaproteobacteria bacterium]|jgi:NAD+ synthetase